MTDRRFLTAAVLFYGTLLPYHRGKWRVMMALRRFCRLAVTGEHVVRRQGLMWSLDPSDQMQVDLFWLGITNRWEVEHIRRLLVAGSVFFDIGANFGYYAVTLAARWKNAGHIYAFEPVPSMYRKILRHCEMNRLTAVSAYCMALSDNDGEAAMTFTSGNSGGARLVEGRGVRVTTLDRFCREQRIDRLDFLKIDVEGLEERVIRGGMETLARLKPGMQIEVNPPLLVAQNSSVERLSRVLQELGYRFYGIRRNSLRPIEELPGGDDLSNVFCFHSESPIRP